MARVRVEVPVEKKYEPTNPEQASAMADVPTHAPASFINRKVLFVAAIILGLIMLISLVNDRNNLRQQLESKNGTESGNSQEVEQIVSVLNKSVELPHDETPQMRIIEDASKFAQQNPALADIKNGDAWLFYAKSGKLVIYRPSTEKVIFVVSLVAPSGNNSGATQ